MTKTLQQLRQVTPSIPVHMTVVLPTLMVRLLTRLVPQLSLIMMMHGLKTGMTALPLLLFSHKYICLLLFFGGYYAYIMKYIQLFHPECRP